jgi:hypothetical protein
VGDEAGLDCNAADAAVVRRVLRITGESDADALPDAVEDAAGLAAAGPPPPPAAVVAAAVAAAEGAAAAAGPCSQHGALPVLPAAIIFPGSRRTSKTLALLPLGDHPGSAASRAAAAAAVGEAAHWLGPVGVPVLREGACVWALRGCRAEGGGGAPSSGTV